MIDMDNRVVERLDQLRGSADNICKTLEQEIQKLGFRQNDIPLISVDRARFSLDRDPASGLDSLVGTWCGPTGAREGGLTIHADGSFFAEYDVIRPHPEDRRWFVEAVTAWGRDELIKSEPRLLPALD